MAELFGWSFVGVWCLAFGALLVGMYRLRQKRAEVESELALALAEHVVAQNKAIAFDSLLREVQRVYLDAQLAHEAVEWEVLQVEQVRGRRVH